MLSFQLNSLTNKLEMEKGTSSTLSIVRFIVLVALLLPRATLAEPRAQVIEITCTNERAINDSTFLLNFVPTMENIRTQIERQGYGIASTGQGPDAFYNLVQCYGDLSLTDCMLCYAAARTILPQCFPFNGGRLFLDGCFMRAANYSFFQEYAGPEDRVVCGNRTRKDSAFQETARRAVLQAASFAPNNKGYARAEMLVPGTSNESAFVLANCWSSLNANSCRACLENASTSLLGCLPRSESRALNTGCFMRYSDTNFLNPIPSNSSSAGTPAVVIAVVASSTVVVAGAAVIGAYIWKHKRIQKKRKGTHDAKKLAKTLQHSSLHFEYSTLEKATGDFDEANKLGQGGFGTVYKGVLPDGREIAVKRLFFNNIHRVAEFYNEINIITSVEHKNLVKLLGCSCFGPESLLVYEFLPNESLDRFIFDSSKGKTLNWEKRFEITIGIAEGLVHLHENPKVRIIHRDIKASNILLDMRLHPKIADFGLARCFQEDESHISTAIAGTLGYMAPEYLSHGQLTEKADVYSFGILLLEIITGRQNNTSQTSEYSSNLVTITWTHFQQGTAEELTDPNLKFRNYYNINVKNEVLRMIHIALLCIQEIPSLRPSMSETLQMLAKEDKNLPPPTNPPFLDDTFQKSSYAFIPGNPDSVATMSQSVIYPR